MNLMNMVRLCGLVVIGWTLMAMGVGMFVSDLRPAAETNFFLPKPALHEAVAVSPPTQKGMEEYRLIDRSTGRAEPLPLPEDASWGFLSVAPGATRKATLKRWADGVGSMPAASKPFAVWGCSAWPTPRLFTVSI